MRLGCSGGGGRTMAKTVPYGAELPAVETHRRAGRAMMTTLLSPEIVTAQSLIERCDRCGAAAKLEVALTGGGELAFCGHHANKHAAEITRIAGRVTVEDGFAWAGPVQSA